VKRLVLLAIVAMLAVGGGFGAWVFAR